MSKVIKFAIGFVTGRANVCDVINGTYRKLMKQFATIDKQVELTIYVMYDLNYQYTKREDFYNILPSVNEKVNIRYITPEDIEQEKSRLIKQERLTKEDVNLFLGYGHAKGRNSVMYYAMKEKMNYLLFWDDDEYPIACIKQNDKDKIIWKEQDNLAMHLKYIGETDITIGYHCGYISPIPYMDLENIDEERFKNFIEAMGNDIISWDSIKEKFIKYNGITYANEEIANGQGAYEVKSDGIGKWVSGSTLCINLSNIERIPAFYNPEGARGEDTFFSTKLNNTKVMKIPVYHFHDAFLKYTNILKEKYPENLEKIKSSEKQIEQRFFTTSRGWIRYKPLFEYITDRENYEINIKDTYHKLKIGISEMNRLFQNKKFDILLEELKEYDKNVKSNYNDYIKTNEIWEYLKDKERSTYKSN